MIERIEEILDGFKTAGPKARRASIDAQLIAAAIIVSTGYEELTMKPINASESLPEGLFKKSSLDNAFDNSEEGGNDE